MKVGEGHLSRLPVDGRVMFVQPWETEHHRVVGQTGHIQVQGLGVIARASDFGIVVAGDGACSGWTAIDEFDWDRLGVWLDDQVMVCEEGWIHEVARCTSDNESEHGNRGKGILQKLDGSGKLAGNGVWGGWVKGTQTDPS